jgi:hypothetical protein
MRLFLAMFLLVGLAGCAVKQNPAHTKIYTPTGVIDYHCPPGHAKKGHC